MDWEPVCEFVAWWTTARAAAAAGGTAALAAVIAATSGIKTLRQNRRDSQARSRPMVAAELRDHPYAKATQILVIKNYGPSIARNLSVSFDPDIPDPADPSTSATPYLKNRYLKLIPVLTPGMELDNIYYSGRRGKGNRWVNAEPTPSQVTVNLRYENDEGDKFHDAFPLDVNLIRNRTYVTSSNDPQAFREEVAAALKGLHKVVKSLEERLRDPLGPS
ncbi:MAG: hypothetical protein H0U53_01970 [Actinobacteria bacterium]|nr:hypothetical protein [Actinomycetota bacterium]